VTEGGALEYNVFIDIGGIDMGLPMLLLDPPGNEPGGPPPNGGGGRDDVGDDMDMELGGGKPNPLTDGWRCC